MVLSLEQEEEIIKIGKVVAKNSWLEDKEEALSVALLGITRGINTYDERKGAKWGTYLYRCAQLEVYVEWRKQNTHKRGKGYATVSLDELKEKGEEL